MNKLTTILMSILLLGIIVPVVAPTAFVAVPSHAANNTIILQGYTVKSGYPYYSISTASINISAYSASSSVVKIDSTPAASNTLLDINLTGITISSGTITLYSSTNALASIGSGDVAYATLPTSYITLTHHTTTKGPLEDFYNYTSNGVTYSLGNDSIIGPSPNNIGGGSYYIKGFFGSSAPVATSTAQLIILPNISISPTSGGAGRTITVTGTGFTSSSRANVTWKYIYDNAGLSHPTTVTQTGISINSTGGFAFPFKAPEMALNDSAGYTSNVIAILGNDTSTLRVTPTYSFTEIPRTILAFNVTSPSGTVSDLIPPTPYPTNGNINGTSTPIGSIYVLEPVLIKGNYFDPSSTLTFTLGGTSIGTATTNSSGYFETTLSIPVSAGGVHSLNITDPLAYVAIHVTTSPTLIVSPTSVQPGGVVNVNGYAFTASKAVNVTWISADGHQYELVKSVANLSTSSLGEFTTSFTLPMLVEGGTAAVNASMNRANPTAYTTFTIVPRLVVSPTTAALGSQVTATVYALDNGSVSGTVITSYPSTTITLKLGHGSEDYNFAYDNTRMFGYTAGVSPFSNATLSSTFLAVGIPMVHYVQVYNESAAPMTMIAYTSLNVTGTTAESSQISSLSSMLTSIESSLYSITSTLTSVSSSLTNISSGITNIKSTLSSITSSLSSISGTLTSMGSTLTSIQTAVSGLNTASLASTLSNVMTYLLVVAVLAIIIIVLEIVLLVRKK